MKQVDFYLISNAVSDANLKLASRLSNKLQRMQQKTLLITSDSSTSDKLDELMWSFSETSFLTHERLSDREQNMHTKTFIAETSDANVVRVDHGFDVLINLSDTVPICCHHFDRIAEIVPADQEAKQLARVRFKQYKMEGYDLKTHAIEL